ncbi:MAG: PKD domain-containing protein [Bacteroidia bacterium]
MKHFYFSKITKPGVKLAIAFVCLFGFANAQLVSLLAGSSTQASGAANNATGTKATFDNPQGVTTDGSGNLYVADMNNFLIRKIVIASPSAVTTLAGNTNGGFTNGTGTAAAFNQPVAVAYYGGDLYVADEGNNAIRKIVVSTGVVTTLAGSTAGTSGSTNGTGTAAKFNSPDGIAVESGGADLYVAEFGNNDIRKIVISSGAVTTLAGQTAAGSANGTGTAAKFNQPAGLIADASGNLYVADWANNLIRKIVISSGVVTTFAGNIAGGASDGKGTAASFSYPSAIVEDAFGNLYVTDENNNEVRKIIISSATVTTYAGSSPTSGYINGLGGNAEFYTPNGITVDDSDNVYVSDQQNNDMRKIVPYLASFEANNTAPCSGNSIQFTDTSADAQTSWSWTFQGGTPATSTAASPTITYNTAGTYSVSLTSANSYAKTTNSQTGYITVNASPTITITGTTTICDGASTTLTASGTDTYSWTGGPPAANYTVSPTTTTTYTVIGTAIFSTGCTDSATQVVTVNPLPTVTISGTSTICDGSNTTLTASGANTYAWSPATDLSATTGSPVTASPTTTTTYTVTGTNTVTSCSNIAKQAVTVDPLPVVTISGTTSICDGSNTILTASGANTYTWSPATGLSETTGNSVTANPTITTT